MSVRINGLGATLGAFAMVASLGAHSAVASNDRAVEEYSCKDVMRENGVNRNSAIAFLHGYILGKSGNSKFNLETLTKQTDAFIDSCLDKPANKALDVMMQVKQ